MIGLSMSKMVAQVQINIIAVNPTLISRTRIDSAKVGRSYLKVRKQRILLRHPSGSVAQMITIL